MKKRFLYPFAILLLVSLWVGLSLAQEPDDILKKHVDALGGEEDIRNVETLFGRGKISMAGIEGRMEAWWSKPDKVRQEFYFPVFGPLIVSDGETFWVKDRSGEARKLGEGKWMELLDELFLENHEHLFSENRKEMGKAVVETSGDQPAHLIMDIVSQEGRLKRLFIDDSSYLIDEYHLITSQDSVAVRLSDYRDVGGVMFPFRIHRTTKDPHSDTFVDFVEIATNLPLSESLFVRPEGIGRDYRFVSGSGRVTVPFELVSNHIYFEAKVNDSPPLSFLLDTGAQLSYLDFSRAEELKIRKTERRKTRGVGTCDGLSFFQIDSIKIGLTNASSDGSGFAQDENLTLYNQIMGGISLGQVEEFDGKRLDGILGYDFLRRFVVEIDYVRGVLTLYEAKNFNYAADGEVMGIKMKSYMPAVKAVVDGEYEGIFIIDTGSRNHVDLYAPFVTAHRLLEEYPNYLETHVGFGIVEPAKGVVGRAKSFQLGSFLIDSPVTGFHLEGKAPLGCAKAAGRIGGGILRRFKVILDYSHYRMILEKNADYHMWDRYNTSGLQLIRRGEKILVFHVIKDSPAQKAKIEEGDELLSVNDVPASSCSLQKIRELLNQEEGTRIELKLKKKGKTVGVKLILRDMI
jgi:outer membrane lipoprotein-sorting protein